MNLNHRRRVALTLLGLLALTAGCSHNAQPVTSESSATDPVAVTPFQAATSTAPPVMSAETATEVQSALNAAQAAAQTQNYSDPVQRFDTLRSAGKLTAGQLARIQDAETRLMRELAAKAAAGDQNALRQFRQLADRPR
jgi:acyl-CoA reductase-like NAD-dependent aldehyde dehydrogenase